MASARARTAVRVGGALAGIGLTALVAHRTGAAALAAALGDAAPVLPLCGLLELIKVGCEALASRAVLGAPARLIPWGRLFQVHLVTGAVAQIFPAPRPAAEAVKATLLLPWIELPESTSAGATLQSATFLSVALLSLAGALATPLSPSGALLAGLLYGNVVMLALLGVGLRAMLRSRRATAWLARRFPKRAQAIVRFHRAACVGHVVALVPALLLALGMMCNVTELFLIARAIGVDASAQGAFSAFGVQLVAATLGVLVPGQLGAREAAFGMAADVLHTTEVRATAIALSAHAVQLGLAALGFAVLAALRRPAVSEPGASSPAGQARLRPS